MIEWINKRLDKMMFDNLVKADFGLTEADTRYLEELGKQKPDFAKILEKISTAIVVTGMNAKTVEGVKTRNDWMQCMRYLRRLMAEKPRRVKMDRIRNEELSDKIIRRSKDEYVNDIVL